MENEPQIRIFNILLLIYSGVSSQAVLLWKKREACWSSVSVQNVNISQQKGSRAEHGKNKGPTAVSSHRQQFPGQIQDGYQE